MTLKKQLNSNSLVDRLEQLKSISWLKRFYHATLGDSNQEIIKPINWHNLPYWLRYTLKSDFRNYSMKPRSLSAQRLAGLIKPNLNNPIFIVGAPRSGTTFLGDSIASIPEISYHFEPVATKAATRYVHEGLWSEDKSKRFYRSIYSWLMRIHFDADLRFAEKTPQISFIIPFLANTFPQAKFIHIIRDGRDSAISLSEKPWHRSDNSISIRDPDGYLCGPGARFWVEPDRVEEFEATTDLHRCIWIWRLYVQAVLNAKSNLCPQSYHELKYEDLVKNPSHEANKIADFLDIDNPNSRSIFHDQITSNIRANSIGRWKTFFSENKKDLFDLEANNLMQQLGYLV